MEEDCFQLQVHYWSFIHVPKRKRFVEAKRTQLSEKIPEEDYSSKVFTQSLEAPKAAIEATFRAITLAKSTMAHCKYLAFELLKAETHLISHTTFPLEEKKITTEYRCRNLWFSDKD